MFECKICGNCCRDVIVIITYDDVKRWEIERRWDILSEVRLLIDPVQKIELPVFFKSARDHVCPFLSDANRCNIYPTRPGICKDFPVTGRADKILECKAMENDEKLELNRIQKIYHEQMEKLSDTKLYLDEIIAIILNAPMMQFQISKGLMKWDESVGKYRLTEKGQRFHEDEIGRLAEKSHKCGKTVEQLARESYMDILKPKELEKFKDRRKWRLAQ